MLKTSNNSVHSIINSCERAVDKSSVARKSDLFLENFLLLKMKKTSPNYLSHLSRSSILCVHPSQFSSDSSVPCLSAVGAPHELCMQPLSLSMSLCRRSFLTASPSRKPVHSQMLTCHLCFRPPLRFPPGRVPCRIVCASPFECVACPNHPSFRFSAVSVRYSHG